MFPKTGWQNVLLSILVKKRPRQEEAASRKRKVQYHIFMHSFLKLLPRNDTSHFCSIRFTQNYVETGKPNSTLGLEWEPERFVEKQQWLLFNKFNLKDSFYFFKANLLNVFGILKKTDQYLYLDIKENTWLGRHKIGRAIDISWVCIHDFNKYVPLRRTTVTLLMMHK